jgi:hypothetical protein
MANSFGQVQEKRMIVQARGPNREFQVTTQWGRNMKRRFLQDGGLAATILLAAGLAMTGPVEAQNSENLPVQIGLPGVKD